MRRAKESGLTLIEVAIVVAVLGVGMLITLSSMKQARVFSDDMEARVSSSDASSRPMSRISDLLSECAIEHIDTTWRFHSVDMAVDIASDRFTVQNLSQCTSAVCPFHTRRDLSIDRIHYVCGFENRSGFGAGPVVRGKVFPASVANCPYDGAALQGFAAMDGVKLIVSRRADGSFDSVGGAPALSGLVFLFPVVVDDGLCHLSLYRLEVNDLMAAGPLVTPTWTRWATPTMVDLLDFGTDGTSDGVPDGKVPTQPGDSDASVEFFSLTMANGEPSIQCTKVLNDPGDPLYRRFLLTIRLSDGLTTFNIVHQDTTTESWSVQGQLVRAPQVLAENVTELAISTSTSNPHDPANNPTGLSEDGLVRVALGSTREVLRSGNRTWQHHVDIFTVRPRN